MARKPASQAPAPADLPEMPQELVEAANTTAKADEVAEAVYELGAMMGGMEAFEFMATIANSGKVAIYEKVKKTKAWMFLKDPRNGDGRHFESIDEFCEVKLGTSYRRMRELLSNKKNLGAEAFEQGERIGLRQVDYNIIKALPAPKQEIIKEALAEGATKEELQKAIRELAAADQKEIETLTKQRDEARAEAEAKTEVMDTTEQQLRQTKEELARSRKMLQTLNPDERIAHMRQELSLHFYHAESAIIGALAVGYEGLSEHDPQAPLYMAGFVRQLELHLLHLRERYALPDALDEEALNWQDPEYQAQLAAQIEAQKPDWMKAEAEG